MPSFANACQLAPLFHEIHDGKPRTVCAIVPLKNVVRNAEFVL